MLFHHPRLTVIEDDVELPGGHITKYVQFTNTHDAVTVIATRGNSILIQEEYSYPPNQRMYEFPGGGIDEDSETTLEAALRELQEETGHTGDPTYIGYYFTNNRRSNAKMHVVLVENTVECVKTNGDIEESIIPKWVLLTELDSMIADGTIVNLSILAGMSLFNTRRE